MPTGRCEMSQVGQPKTTGDLPAGRWQITIVDRAGLVGGSGASARATEWDCYTRANCARSWLLAAAPDYRTIGGLVRRK